MCLPESSNSTSRNLTEGNDHWKPQRLIYEECWLGALTYWHSLSSLWHIYIQEYQTMSKDYFVEDI